MINQHAPASLDWRNNNGNRVTSVKDQGLSCPGAGAYFAAAAQSESWSVLHDSQPLSVDLSEQFLLQCAQNTSCASSSLENSIDKALHGIPHESDFPYNPLVSTPNICSAGKLVQTGDSLRVTVRNASDAQIITMLQTGPVAAWVSTSDWHRYTQGVISCPTSSTPGHAVVIVGYTPTYWIVKNSWGSDYGLNGYVHIDRNRNSNCQIHQAVSLVSLSERYVMMSLLLALVLLMILH